MKNYKEVYSFGRGAGTDKACTVAFELAIKLVPVEENINVLQEKAGLSIIYLPSGKRSISGFICVDKLIEVNERTSEGLRLIFDREMHPQAAAQEPYVFKMGNGFKGKTPEQLLLEGMSEEQMLSQRNWLANNCTGKFAEANRKGVIAIDSALEKWRNGSLNVSDCASSVFSIFTSGPRYMPRRDLRQPYETEGWELDVRVNPADRNPWSITWQSKTVTVDGNVIVASKNPVTYSVNATTEEWLAGLKKSVKYLNKVEDLYFPYHYKYCVEHENDWKKNNNGNYCKEGYA